MDIRVTASLTQEDHDDLLLHVKLRTTDPSMTVATYIEQLVMTHLRQAVNGIQAWKIAEIPSATVRDALVRVSTADRDAALALLQLKQEPDGRFTPDPPPQPDPIAPGR